MNILDANLAALHRHYPDLAARLDGFPDKHAVRVLKAKDGSIAYGLQKNGAIAPLMDTVAPLSRIQQQLNDFHAQLADFTRPVLLVGLYPGNDLAAIFDYAENDKNPHCRQHIHVVIDSLPCLYGFLQTWDARRLLESDRLHWLWHEELPSFVGHLRNHPEIPHLFTLVSGAPDSTLNRLLPPLVQLVQERETELSRLQAENNAYYDALDDAQLARIIAGSTEIAGEQLSGFRSQPPARRGCAPGAAGGSSLSAGRRRRPRLLMPTCSWSTFVQHSARDTCAAFDALGWETRILKLDAMLTPYYLVQQIHEFKPDVFLFIDHFRHEAEEAYPRNLLFISWIQDDLSHIHRAETGRKLTEYASRRKRDLVIGYADEALTRKYGYPKDRLFELRIPANPHIFTPLTLSPSHLAQYGCDLAFMSNVSMPSERIIDTGVAPAVSALGISRRTVEDIHDYLWKEYRAGRTFLGRNLFLAELFRFDEFKSAYTRLNSSIEPNPPRAEILVPGHTLTADGLYHLFYWRLNDIIFRHVVLEWADELGIDLRIYGLGWENHPRFKKYAQGFLAHGPQLNIAYQAARLNLHLNCNPGMHQRLWEILTAGATPFLRAPPKQPDVAEPPAETMHRLVLHILNSGANAPDNALTDNEELADWIFNAAFTLARDDAKTPAEDGKRLSPEYRVNRHIEDIVFSRPDWVIGDWDRLHFTNKAEFNEKLAAYLSANPCPAKLGEAPGERSRTCPAKLGAVTGERSRSRPAGKVSQASGVMRNIYTKVCREITEAALSLLNFQQAQDKGPCSSALSLPAETLADYCALSAALTCPQSGIAGFIPAKDWVQRLRDKRLLSPLVKIRLAEALVAKNLPSESEGDREAATFRSQVSSLIPSRGGPGGAKQEAARLLGTVDYRTLRSFPTLQQFFALIIQCEDRKLLDSVRMDVMDNADSASHILRHAFAAAYKSLGMTDQARSLTESVEPSGLPIGRLFPYATLCLSVGLPDKARQAVASLSEASGALDIVALQARVLCATCSHRFNEALKEIEAYRKAITAPMPAVSFMELDVRLLLGQFAEAQRLFETLKSFPDFHNYGAFYQAMLALGLNQHEQALECFRQICPVDEHIVSQQITKTWGWLVFFEYAQLLRYLGRYEEALRAARAGSRLDEPENACPILEDLIRFEWQQIPLPDGHAGLCLQKGAMSLALMSLGIWPLYQAWLFFRAACAFHIKGDAEREHSALHELLRCTALDPKTCAKLTERLDAGQPWHDRTSLDLLVQAFYPFYAPTSYHRQSLLRECQTLLEGSTVHGSAVQRLEDRL